MIERATDWEALRGLRLRALRDAPAAFLMTYEREAADPAERWRQLVADDAQRVFVDAEGRGMVGAYATEAGVGLWGLWVAPEARGHGLGAALVQAVVEWAGERPVTLAVLDAQPALMRFYGRLGFEATGAAEPLPEDPARTIVTLRRPAG